jgi:hypothetical protein
MKELQIVCVRCEEKILRKDLKYGMVLQPEDGSFHTYEICPHCGKWGCARLMEHFLFDEPHKLL